MEKKELLVSGIKESALTLDKKTHGEVVEMLKNEARYMLENKFEKPLPLRIPIELSGRLKSTMGYFRHTKTKAVKITIATEQVVGALAEGNFDSVLDTLRHEVVHYALFVMGRDYKDGSLAFESALARLNISSSGHTAEHKCLSDKALVWYSVKDKYGCTCCGKTWEVKHTKKVKSYRCVKCSQNLVALETNLYKVTA